MAHGRAKLMSLANTATRGTVANRPTASRKLLGRKAAERAAEGISQGVALEDSFPQGAGEAPHDDGLIVQAAQEITGADETAAENNSAEVPTPEPAAEPEDLTVEPAAATSTVQPATAPEWSEDDERTFQRLLARRKAAGYQRRGKDVSGQLLRVGEVAPNPGTVAAVIAALVAERGTVSRADLVAAMAAATFPHPRARPADKSWCVGYIAGGIRDGFLAEAAANRMDDAVSDAAGASDVGGEA
jgi:hypothetical protein